MYAIFFSPCQYNLNAPSFIENRSVSISFFRYQANKGFQTVSNLFFALSFSFKSLAFYSKNRQYAVRFFSHRILYSPVVFLLDNKEADIHMICANNIALAYGKQVLFKDVNIMFKPGNCYGLIGANGAGKSTFLKILAKEIEPDAGDISVGPKERIAVLRQDHFAFDTHRVLDTVIMGHEKGWIRSSWGMKNYIRSWPNGKRCMQSLIFQMKTVSGPGSWKLNLRK
ncbi:MAG: ATP-binding cassette domain-containing protein [Desulfotignum sp.]|nr:ATP-binding cassette domain-containing protein [Desulfotignum sp.]